MTVYQSRFTQVNYDKECGERQKLLRNEFYKLEAYVMENFGKTENIEAFEKVVEYIKDNFPGFPRGKENGFEVLWKAHDEFKKMSSLEQTLDYLDVAYMWFGKPIREEQIAKNQKPQ